MPQDNNTRDRLLDVDGVADMVRASVATVWRETKAGRLPRPLYVAPTAPRWRESEVWAALEKTRANPSESAVARRMANGRRTVTETV
jgi:predicted DNA-binding transcriptional regulator AlpA